MEHAAAVPGRTRLLALDVLRGLAVAGMILVTSPGSWSYTYAELNHAAWNGWTVADLVFPTFLFGVGMALGLSFPRPLGRAAARMQLWRRIARRTAALIALGLLLNLLSALAFSDLAHARLPGILQRIALCYLLGCVLVMATGRTDAAGRMEVNRTAMALAIAFLLAGYWALMMEVPVPGYGAGRLDPEGNLAAWIDRAVFTPRHLWSLGTAPSGAVTYDPEGLLSSFPATTNLLWGLLAATEWQRAGERSWPRVALAGLLLVLAGLAVDPVFPINKRIWTSSFALLSSGVSALLLVAVAAVARSGAGRRVLVPLQVLGGNAIFAFTLSFLLGIGSGLPLLSEAGVPVSPQKWGFDLAHAAISDPYAASFACAIGILVLIWGATWLLHRRAIHFRL